MMKLSMILFLTWWEKVKNKTSYSKFKIQRKFGELEEF